MFRAHPALYIKVIIFELRIVWHIWFWFMCRSVALPFNWLNSILVIHFSMKHWRAESKSVSTLVGDLGNTVLDKTRQSRFRYFIIWGICLHLFIIELAKMNIYYLFHIHYISWRYFNFAILFCTVFNWQRWIFIILSMFIRFFLLFLHYSVQYWT
jgi:hypothetical protein